MSAVDDLAVLVPPPARPFDAVGDWVEVEDTLGLRLPTDFKALISMYGVGAFNGFVWLVSPFDADESLIADAAMLSNEHAAYLAHHRDANPHPLYPTPGGLLIWGKTIDDDRVCWLTDGDPDTWPVVTWQLHGDHHVLYPVGAAELLHGWLTARISVDLLRVPDPMPPWFEPYRDRVHISLGLTDGDLPYARRLDILRDELAPTAYRGRVNHDGVRQDLFNALTHDWELMYENAYGHQIRIGYPPGMDDLVRTTMIAVVERMGCRIHSVETIDGEPIDWNDGI